MIPLRLKAIAVDDERPALEVLEAFSDRTELLNLRKTFTRTVEAHQYVAEQPVDLLFLDINMPNQNGMEFFKAISPAAPLAVETDRMVIFTTAHSEYAVESYTLNAIDYLLKPFTFERFLQAVQKAHDQLIRQANEISQGYLIFRVDYSLVKVFLADILFVEGLDNYLKIHLVHHKPVVVRLTIKAMLAKLPTRGFVRVHRSYIISLSKIQAVRNKLILIGSEEIPLSSSYESDFYAVFLG